MKRPGSEKGYSSGHFDREKWWLGDKEEGG